MQPQNLEESTDTLIADPPLDAQRSTAQHGDLQDDSTWSPAYSQGEEYSGLAASGSEWSLSTTPTDAGDNWLKNRNDASVKRILSSTPESTAVSTQTPGSTRRSKDHSPLQELPEELLFHVISHLSADDLLAVKLVSRRFHDVVSSPHAWVTAFARYFPGPDALRATADTHAGDQAVGDLRTEKRSFTRLSAVASWTGEYLLRTKMLRCLGRGRPALPFACPAPGKSNKGYATFTFSSRLRFGITHMDAKFGPVLDKRLPQFIHGYNMVGTVSSSDKRGKFDGWGLTDRIAFNTFAELYPGTAQWGLGLGEIVGLPNVMDLSVSHGMIYGEGLPGGLTYFLPAGEKHGRYLAPFLDEGSHKHGMPKLSPDTPSVCSAWIPKTSSVPSLTRGIVGMMTGSSNGVVSAYSLGASAERSQQGFERGELTARWALSPGVPIIALAVDEQYSESRNRSGRLSAVALNALGEVFVLRNPPCSSSEMSSANEETLLYLRETRAWRTGYSSPWQLISASQRKERQAMSEHDKMPEYYPRSVWTSDETATEDLGIIQSWTLRTPREIKADFDGWDMRQRLEVDFAGDDGKAAGENILVMKCGFDEDHQSSIIRYTRMSSYNHKVMQVLGETNASGTPAVTPQPSIFNNAHSTLAITPSVPAEAESHSRGDTVNSHMEWRCSTFTLGKFKSITITASTLDNSLYALTTSTEDIALRHNKSNDNTKSKGSKPAEDSSTESSPLKAPGQRSRFVAAGTNTGAVLLWDIRAPPPSDSRITNAVRPFRIINTDSPEISSLALSALYLVHGGSEGLVQAWDPLASTLEPVRTISSRNTLNARRRAVIASQNNPLVQVQLANISYAASAICLDPDPTILRGVVAMGSHLRYWSYSSADAVDELSKSQKRRINRAMRGLNSSSGDPYIGTRRVSLKGVVGQQIAERNMELKEQQAERKAERKLAGRFGLDLLGDDASEEDMLAYAKLLSQEEQENRVREALATQAKLSRDATEAEVEAYLNSLSEEDRQKWRYASWQERYDMPVSSEVSNSGIRSSPAIAPQDIDVDLAQALRLSLEDSSSAPSPMPMQIRSSQLPRSPSPFSAGLAPTPAEEDDDINEAIRLSLASSTQRQDSKTSKNASATLVSSSVNGFRADELDDETAEAIRLSLADTESHLHQAGEDQRYDPSQRHMSQEDDELAQAIKLSLQANGREHEEGKVRRGSAFDEDDFPTLSSASSPGLGGQSTRRGKGKGKGKGKSIW